MFTAQVARNLSLLVNNLVFKLDSQTLLVNNLIFKLDSQTLLVNNLVFKLDFQIRLFAAINSFTVV